MRGLFTCALGALLAVASASPALAQRVIAAAQIDGVQGSRLPPYMGPVASRTAIANADGCAVALNGNGTCPNAAQVMAQSQHPLLEDVSAIEVWYAPTWRVPADTGAETLRGAGATCRASATVVDMTGNLVTTRLLEKGSGADTATATDGGYCKFTGAVSAARGQRLKLRVWVNAPAGMFYQQQIADYTNGDTLRYGSTTPDLTGTTTAFSDSWTGNRDAFLPSLIIGSTTRRTVAIIGDSRDVGIADVANDGWGCIGGTARLLCRYVATVNVSSAGLTAAGFAVTANSTRRRELASYASDVAMGLGVNDTVAQGATAAATLANIQTIVAAIGKPAIYKTINPEVNSNNTAMLSSTNDLKRQALNASLRAYPVFDAASVVETTAHLFGSATYIASDGIHETNTGNAYAAATASFDWSFLGRPIPLTILQN